MSACWQCSAALRLPRRMLRKTWRVVVVSAVLALAVPAAASASAILGSTVKPAGSTSEHCAGVIRAQLTSDPATPYTVPAGGAGYLTQWQTNTALARPGSQVTFTVLAPTSKHSSYLVAGFDAETLPNPLPAGHLITFNIAQPILVGPGALIGLWASPDSGADCVFAGGATPAAASVALLGKPLPGPFLPGEKVSVVSTDGPGVRVNVAAVLVHYQDAAVQALSVRSKPAVGRRTVLTFAVFDRGPSVVPIRFTDLVSRGLKVDSVAARRESCAVHGHRVSCVISRLRRGERSLVRIVVTPTAAGHYSNTASVNNAARVADPNHANNRSSTALTVPLSRIHLTADGQQPASR